MGKILSKINGPRDIQKLSMDELDILAEEIRELIINTVSKTGGHLAPSLGTVELTLALFRVFSPPTDKIIWDVGHQSYPHKIITGRRKRFGTLRQLGGISGFPKIKESPLDTFGTGHSSTSISAALGISSGKSLKNDDGMVIAVIGDGSMTGGEAFEGLNQTGHLNKNIIVILNDNEMSINPNVGALSSFFSRKLSSKPVINLKREIEAILRSVPGIGDNIVKVVKKAEDAIKGFMTPGMLFESMNFQYYGPIDGHRIDRLVETLSNVKEINAPILVHIMTKKGKGYIPAEEDPSKFHGIGPFDVDTGDPAPSNSNIPSYTKIFGNTVLKLAKKNKKIVTITAAMSEGTGLTLFAKKYPDRFFDVGIAEQHGVTFAAGLATQGLIPIFAVYSTFLQRAYDQVLHDVCLQELPVVFCIDRGGIVGEDGPTHHGLFDIAYLRGIPNLIFMSPKDENELARMLVTATKHKMPSAIRYPRGRGLGVKLDLNPKELTVGKAEVITEGDDLTIVALGPMVAFAEDAVKRLETRGITTTFINARFIKPLDINTIRHSIEKTGALLTVEEGILNGGFGSGVLEAMTEISNTPFFIKRLGIADEFVEHGPQNILRERYGLSPAGIFEAGLKLVEKKKKGRSSMVEIKGQK
jgi:1-deoxy-D-xylulose-5-phosphate synthase